MRRKPALQRKCKVCTAKNLQSGGLRSVEMDPHITKEGVRGAMATKQFALGDVIAEFTLVRADCTATRNLDQCYIGPDGVDHRHDYQVGEHEYTPAQVVDAKQSADGSRANDFHFTDPVRVAIEDGDWVLAGNLYYGDDRHGHGTNSMIVRENTGKTVLKATKTVLRGDMIYLRYGLTYWTYHVLAHGLFSGPARIGHILRLLHEIVFRPTAAQSHTWATCVCKHDYPHGAHVDFAIIRGNCIGPTGWPEVLKYFGVTNFFMYFAFVCDPAKTVTDDAIAHQTGDDMMANRFRFLLALACVGFYDGPTSPTLRSQVRAKLYDAAVSTMLAKTHTGKFEDIVFVSPGAPDLARLMATMAEDAVHGKILEALARPEDLKCALDCAVQNLVGGVSTRRT
jgi:hypothetical protein